MNESLEVIGRMTSLRDLRLAKNLLLGPLRSELNGLKDLEILDLQGNTISALPHDIHQMVRLRILNLNENSIDSLSFAELARLPLTELLVRKNKLSGTLIEEGVASLPQLQTLDVSANQLTRLVPLGSAISLPELHVLSLSMNRLQGLPDMTSWSNLLTLTVDENSISGIPNSFTALEKLRHADFSSNDIRVIPPEISRMTNLSMIRLSGNPLRDKKFVSITTDELKDALSARLEPPPPYQEPGVSAQPAVPDFLMDTKASPDATTLPSKGDHQDDDSRSDEDFATPPTSAPHSPSRARSQTMSSVKSRSMSQVWPVKQGLLDRSRTELSTLHPVVCSKVAAEHQVTQVHLQHNLFSSIPNSLSFFADTLAALSLSNNQLIGQGYLAEDLEFPKLRELNLSSNRVTSLEPLLMHLHAPSLEKLDISINRINALPVTLKEVFPALSILLVSNNQLIDLDPEAIRGLKIVDASSNDISHLNPRIGLLGGPGGLERLDVMGNRFRVPRWNVLERGTEATLRWLRGRVPVAEMAAWKGDEDEDVYGDVD
jgi:Leucine-rich repeat (LRR) protein